jgi:L-rhamnonate dehydratase
MMRVIWQCFAAHNDPTLGRPNGRSFPAVQGRLEHDALDIFMPNSMYNGGMTETRRVAHLAQIYNRPLSDAGGGGIYCLHHVAGFRNGTLVECHLGVEQLEQAIFIDAPEPIDGRVHVPERPGFGVTLNRDVLKDTLVRPE